MKTNLVIFLCVVLFVYSVCNEDIPRKSLLDEQHPATEFSRHTLVKPKLYHGREKRQISSTKHEVTGTHTDYIQIKMEVDGQDMILDLTINKDLIPQGFFHKHQENGDYKIHKPSLQDVDLCDYSGKVRGKPDSWVAISTCDGLSGVIFDGKEMHYIETKNKLADIQSEHFLYKHSDSLRHNKTCGYKGDVVDHENSHDNKDDRILRYKRDQPLLRGPYNANKESKYVELVLVIDNQLYKQLGESKTETINHAKSIANIINGLYSSLNIFIALVGVVIWSENDEIQFSGNGDTTLANFLRYRREKLTTTHPNDNAQLLTKFNFDKGVVGKALKGPICTYEYSGGISTEYSPVVGVVATTVAHMIGHNFGMEHDTGNCKCPDDRCIMTSSSSTEKLTHWSTCSLEYLHQAFSRGMDYCLRNKPKALFDSPVCGNGFVEPGEQCDCGLEEHCDNYCCNANTCMLHSNATCAMGECCDLATCLPKTAGTLCRSADYECDLPEYCEGQSEYCPEDVYKLDGEPCERGQAYCYHGSCRTRSDQCKLLWGDTGKSSDDKCYMLNTKGNRHGNCGYDKITQTYTKCENENVLCGMLQCTHSNEKLEFGMESVAIRSNSFINKNGSIIACQSAIVDLGINQVDPGLTPDGALCGDGKMCVNQTCISVSALRKQGPQCPDDCNGNGWCNNKGTCHCKEGFFPPNCHSLDLGGSQDSGAAVISNVTVEVHPTMEFGNHTIVKPKLYHGREKRQISSTKQKTGTHTDHIQIKMEVDGQDMILDLTINKDLIPQGFFHKHQENGDYKIHKPSLEEVNLCDYSGKVRGKPNSWVAISTCDGLSGVIFDGDEMHYIETRNRTADIESDHFLYKHSDLRKHNKTCGYAGDAVDPKKFHNHKKNRILRYKRDVDQQLVRGPYNANKQSKYVELVLVIDNQQYKELGESKTRTINHAKTIANIINGLYSPLNIFIALVGVVIWSENDEINFSANGDTTLTNFLHYRREKLIKSHPNDNAQLLTKFNFDNGVVGKALKGPICTYEFSGGVNTEHSPVVGLVATTVAHEMGHNFGMEHDTVECDCPDDRCIMAPSSSTVAPKHWSSCSLSYLLQAFTHGMDYCLKNKPKALFDSPVCGNGFVEPGEQCDCGLEEHCDNYCCNASTCMLHSNASCATGECCDLSTCLPKTAGTLCRSADYECDLPEYCTGQSEYCPEDNYKLDTESCDGGRAFCYHGFCSTRSDQCKLLWGDTGKSSDDQCYMMNIKGNRHGNCGYDKLTQTFFKCENESVLCGMLHCKHLNERLEFGMESVAILSHTFINKKGSIIPCRTAIVDLGINQVDPGLTPDGALCGDGKMCVNQKCMSVSSLRKQGPHCPDDCNGNGWCNNRGNCHCKDGFAPPNCYYPGPGGSLDSGPAADPNARQGLVAGLFIFFLGIVPLVAITAFLFYYARHNLRFGRKKSPQSTSKSPSKSRGPPPFASEEAKRTEDNHSLLREESPPPGGFIGLSNNFFGNFKGFSISPLKNEVQPNRSAPPPPVVTPIPKSTKITTSQEPKQGIFSNSIQKYNSFRKSNTLSGGVSTVNNISAAPALPPPNPGSQAKPIISSPILENSTCTAKELVSPLKNAPKVPIRAAPQAPVEVSRPLSTPNTLSTTNVSPTNMSEESKRPKESVSTSTLNRIASFLKPVDKKPSVVQKSTQVKATKVKDKETLRNIEISNPIPQTHIEISVTALPVDNIGTKNVVMRAQSMRATKQSDRPHIQTFGSMRQPSGFKRPVSIPSGNRPKNPPPPRPSLEESQEKSDNSDQYDDCLNEEISLAKNNPSGDNIYAVIEESPVSPISLKSPETHPNNSSSSESMGLLGEIVTEIQNRNFDSIYSTSTLARKKKEEEEKKKNQLSPDSSETYVNTSTLHYPDSEYSNMSGNLKSSASSTSSGYILPSSINVPVKEEPKKVEEIKPNLSSFKADTKPPNKPLTTGFKPAQINLKKIDMSPERNKSKTSSSPTNKTPPKSISRQITPPNLRTRKPSPTRPTPPVQKTNRSVTNSPDLVTSCNTNSSKPPDVLGGGSVNKKPTITSAKPTVPLSKVKNNLKPVNSKSQEKKSEVVANKLGKNNSDTGNSAKSSTGLRNAARSNSNVATLQQKFENKSSAS
ncbi:uncharacterized protein LOC130894422 isoform X1 [Diorhabda carinulata]|uniref:uncharacterized protein LOC130894422 isoform X1 n=1 Tax=Diorhabda carinulata TaxID=1163345 RepID=UPI0025A1629C|nr:uncharacterized protein LOC130894422 isoform X1 [Diorhabda carinulata]